MGKQIMCAEDNRTTKITHSEKFTASGADHLQRFLKRGRRIRIHLQQRICSEFPEIMAFNSLYPALRENNCAQPTNVAYLQFDYSDSNDPRSAHCTHAHTRSARSDET